VSGTGPVKRVTLWVRDAEASLAVYRDALGLEVIEDKRVEGPAIARMVGLDQAKLRIVHLAPAGATHGWVGLYEISATAPRALESLPRPAGFPLYGQATVVLSTDRMAQVVPRLRATAGVQFITAPTEYVKTTAGDATPAGRYSEVIFFDPDGIPVSLIGFAPL
jgi:catechol 2,3-dioxygenase-like lactoylglutathione lyase family enzyme